jgi:hypothetical protein
VIDPAFQVFFSGAGHVYYALIISAGLILAILTGAIGAKWLALPLIAIGGIFADLWAHGYTH